MVKAKDLRDQTIEELEARLEESRKALFELRNEKRQMKKVEKPHLLVEMKRDIAKLLTIIKEKQSEGAKNV